jgi:HJR/Mrr/RecB family endonuclease
MGFYGRNAEVALISELLLEEKPGTVIKVTGADGVGKRRLISEVLRNDRFMNFSPRWISMLEDDIESHLHFVRSIYSRRERLVLILVGVEASHEPLLHRWYSEKKNAKGIVGLILLSRELLAFPGHEIVLSNFNHDEAVEWVTSTFAAVSKNEATRIADHTTGHPLAVTVIFELLRELPVKQVLSTLNGKLYELREREKSQIIQAVRPSIITFSNELIRQLKSSPDTIYDITSRDFEELVAELLRDQGFEVHLTSPTRDKGRDILAFTHKGPITLLTLIEAKKYRKDRPVGIHLVRQLYGTFCNEQASSAMLVTTSHFSPEAKQFVQKYPYQLALKDYADVVKWLMRYQGLKILKT